LGVLLGVFHRPLCWGTDILPGDLPGVLAVAGVFELSLARPGVSSAGVRADLGDSPPPERHGIFVCIYNTRNDMQHTFTNMLLRE